MSTKVAYLRGKATDVRDASGAEVHTIITNTN